MSAPAALLIAKIMVPEVDSPATIGSEQVQVERKTVNLVDAAAQGASQGLTLALNVGAMLIAFLAGRASDHMGDLLIMDAQLEVGFWYFTGYCLFAIAAGALLAALARRELN